MIRATAAMCNCFLPSLDDVRVLSGTTDPHAAIVDWCRGIGAPVVVLKCGGEGVIVSYGRREERIAGHVGRNRRRDRRRRLLRRGFRRADRSQATIPFAAARYANAAAALATTGFGAVAPLPRDADVRALLERAA